MPAKKSKTPLKRKIILGILTFFLIFPLFLRPALAFETKDSQFQFEEALKMEEMNLQSFVNETMKAIAGSIQHFITGNFWDPEVKEKNPGLLGMTTILIAGVYSSPPASGVQYFADIGRQLGITKPVYAQEEIGSGYKIMAITQNIWKAFRNISYILFALILVGMGFAIMFRVKISPQAVITIQSALPRIVLGLILITFSYAIVGLLIDVAIFINGIIGEVFWDLIVKLYKGFGETLKDSVLDFFVAGIENPGGFALGSLTNVLVMSLAIPHIFMFFIFFHGFGLILGLIIGLLLLIAFFRALWTLLKAFAMIVINLVFAPFQILIGVLPGSNAIETWFKNLLANIAVLPVMFTMFLLGLYLMLAGVLEAIEKIAKDYDGALTAIAKFDFPSLGSILKDSIVYGPFWILTALIFPFIGIFILLLIPKAADIIQSAITKKPFDYGTAMGQAMGPAVAVGKPVISGGVEKIYDYGKAPRRQWWGSSGSFRRGAADQTKDWIQNRMKK